MSDRLHTHTHVCPWWFCFVFDNPSRLLYQRPKSLLAPYLEPGMTALDVGCGMGYFSIPMARAVGEEGRVIAVDLQPQMLVHLMRRARRRGVEDRIQTVQCRSDDIMTDGPADFALAIWVVHEVPDKVDLLHQIHSALVPDGRFLLAEPKGHVGEKSFEEIVCLATGQGFQIIDRPRVGASRAVLLTR
jgi:ubiquinone/menaquinone biosynthesis C-methylase UbiE